MVGKCPLDQRDIIYFCTSSYAKVFVNHTVQRVLYLFGPTCFIISAICFIEWLHSIMLEDVSCHCLDVTCMEAHTNTTCAKGKYSQHNLQTQLSH